VVSRPRATLLSPLAAAATAAEYRHEEMDSLRRLHSNDATAATAMADAGAGSSSAFVRAVSLFEDDFSVDDDEASCQSLIRSRDGRVRTGIKESAESKDDHTSSRSDGHEDNDDDGDGEEDVKRRVIERAATQDEKDCSTAIRWANAAASAKMGRQAHLADVSRVEDAC
jgi:hypothetical protein